MFSKPVELLHLAKIRLIHKVKRKKRKSCHTDLPVYLVFMYMQRMLRRDEWLALQAVIDEKNNLLPLRPPIF
jgi:hypothetical protein